MTKMAEQFGKILAKFSEVLSKGTVVLINWQRNSQKSGIRPARDRESWRNKVANDGKILRAKKPKWFVARNVKNIVARKNNVIVI